MVLMGVPGVWVKVAARKSLTTELHIQKHEPKYQLLETYGMGITQVTLIMLGDSRTHPQSTQGIINPGSN